MVDFLLKHYKHCIDETMETKVATPLGYASQLGFPRVVKKLIELGANVNARDASFLTPILRASEAKYTDVIRVLLKNGAGCVDSLFIL